ncbi:type IV toxin-antitoxin system AbiEi family antitoxin domain-containing protein [Arthrobacter sp. B3I4]|uniref:type IV toxin-antitoxin system AbiEi family antitoxin domain-containing protein n=1 Tax=Arthrobacter sp. B3I4 TaxID=3042267 RepID=UPI0027829AD0|nr:type IV toxin-antitoxin system AbiEi family antitoxin domain-containing protein [Arthrobacter sp. B3I4]MDQ0754051.1 very-short-patch-repair endonuclease [Arthrobacter sp. B3I4]
MDLLTYLDRVGGVARTGQLLSAGYSRTDVARLAAVVRQPRRGVFVLQGCKPEFLAAVLHNARVSCASAAGHYGLWLRQPPDRYHLACNHGHGSGFVRHRTVRFQGPAEIPVAAVEDVVLHALGCLAPPASTAIATSAMRLLGVPLELLKSELTADRSGRVREALRQLDLRAESIVEVDAQHLFTTNGIGYDAQVYLAGIGRVDFLLNGFLIVEVDGFAFHSSREALRRDLGRNNAATLNGFAQLRYMPEHIWFEPDRVLAEIRAVLAQGPRHTM